MTAAVPAARRNSRNSRATGAAPPTAADATPRLPAALGGLSIDTVWGLSIDTSFYAISTPSPRHAFLRVVRRLASVREGTEAVGRVLPGPVHSVSAVPCSDLCI